MFARLDRNRFTLLPMVMLAASSLVVGCGAAAKSDSTSSIQAALDAENGGMTTTHEAPAFNDTAVEQLSTFDTTFADATDMTAEAAATPGATRYHVALLWGHLPSPHDGDDSDTDPQRMNWTGAVSVDAGAIAVKRTLAFDNGDKLDPRTDPKSVAFDSHTLPFVDGLFLHVVVPAGGSSTLHFATASLTTDIDLAALPAKEGGVVRLADDRNGLAYVGYADTAGCAKGLLFGRWVKARAQLGRFRGRVIDGDGELIGHVRGVWGHAHRRNADVFFGKYIDHDGDHRGLFGGTYGGGEFHGIWGTVNPGDAGRLEGFYSDGYDRDDGRGVYIGRWSERCGG